jgi:CheY-like chemotaxis protein
MFRSPIPNTTISQMESYSPEQLLSIFESFLKTGSTMAEHSLFIEAWATLFSRLYLTPEELTDTMENGEHRFGEDKEQMLREFIKADCASRGAFVLNIIKKGGMMDRAALIMIADLNDIAGIEHEDTTAIHMLVDACDKKVRPALIRKAGKRLLSTIYDHKDIPALFLFFSLNDLSISDLDAIEKVFSKDDLRKVMSRKRMGKNALQIFAEVSPKVRQNVARERNEFILPTAVKTTNLGKTTGGQAGSPVYRENIEAPPAKVIDRKKAEPDKGIIPAAPVKTSSVVPQSSTAIAKKTKIMIVDDDEIIRGLLQIRLKLLGYEGCTMAESGDEAVKLSEKIKPDLVFMDIMMPGKLDGIGAAKIIKASSNSRIIFLSGYTDQEILDRAKEIEPAGFIVKPFTDNVLRVTLNFLK